MIPNKLSLKKINSLSLLCPKLVIRVVKIIYIAVWIKESLVNSIAISKFEKDSYWLNKEEAVHKSRSIQRDDPRFPVDA